MQHCRTATLLRGDKTQTLSDMGEVLALSVPVVAPNIVLHELGLDLIDSPTGSWVRFKEVFIIIKK